ncbi:hypothetical protein MATL_G00081600 [Megalops atlanticus]|uniref:Uncharacterized protein n=1 Tax=Megalops atlanticus TaxID=7932 RepID=A0A9D3T6Z1_MEGAT|nr:hypothetical protein MATL_G00081600 [Megalops atlanticus]
MAALALSATPGPLWMISELTRRAARLHLTVWCIGEELQTCLSNMQLLGLPLLLLLLPASNTQLTSNWDTDADKNDIDTVSGATVSEIAPQIPLRETHVSFLLFTVGRCTQSAPLQVISLGLPGAPLPATMTRIQTMDGLTALAQV